jgi:uncharacterized protein YjbI with pentapeptide repeats
MCNARRSSHCILGTFRLILILLLVGCAFSQPETQQQTDTQPYQDSMAEVKATEDEKRAKYTAIARRLKEAGKEGAFLEGEDVQGMMLAGVRLKKAKLKGANLRMAMLAGADLRGADLEHADLQNAMLLGANLSGANLANANLEGAMLLGAQLEGARIDGANFNNTFVNQDQIDEACGEPKALPDGLRMPKRC